VTPPRYVIYALPYTTLFRSRGLLRRRALRPGVRRVPRRRSGGRGEAAGAARSARSGGGGEARPSGSEGGHGRRGGRAVRRARARSAEHTSELQSRVGLVCRL